MAKGIKLTGRVFDGMIRKIGGGYEGIPSPKVYISDSDGNITKGKFRVMGDVNGNFILSIPTITIPRGIMSAPVFVPRIDGRFITASYNNERVTKPLNKTNVYNFDLGIKKGIQEVKGVNATAKRVTCADKGGVFDKLSKECIIPNGKKGMSLTVKILIALGVLVVVGGGVYLATKNN